LTRDRELDKHRRHARRSEVWDLAVGAVVAGCAGSRVRSIVPSSARANAACANAANPACANSARANPACANSARSADSARSPGADNAELERGRSRASFGAAGG
jgi:hypothetical protein